MLARKLEGMAQTRAFRTGFATLAFFTLLAGDAWRYSISWWGFAAIVVLLAVASVLILATHAHVWRALPIPLVAFLAVAALSTAWSAYPGLTAVAVVTSALTTLGALAAAVAFSWDELLRTLGYALRLILGLSLVFEFIVSTFVQRPVLPFWVDYGDTEDLPKLLFWSRDLLFDGGKIQGLVGNSSLLAFIALLGIITFGVQLAAGKVGRFAGWFWMLVAVAVVALTRSATIYAALAALVVVVVAVTLLRRARSARGRGAVYWSLLGLVVVAGAAVAMFGTRLLALVGKSPDLTGRLGIWDAVIGLAQERPVQGWGWISYWAPWVEPFDGLVVRGGVEQLHAHNAWLDVWLQLGVPGLITFGALVLTALVRAWQLAVERPYVSPGRPAAFTALSVLPLLLLVALLVQSLAESRLLIEYGLLLLVIVAVKTRRGDPA
ncbi:MAG: exopolysaccharide production protein [Mycetocola sp.]|nr:exopolysaccharide production protein [Mycetocola sp.]